MSSQSKLSSSSGGKNRGRKKSGFQIARSPQLGYFWLYVITIFAIHGAKSPLKKIKVSYALSSYILKFYNFSPIIRLKSITFFFFFFNQKFPFSIFIQFIFNSLLFQIIIFFFNELRKILLLFIYYLFFLFDSLI